MQDHPCNKMALIVAFDGQYGPYNIVLLKTDIDLDMSRSYIQNALSDRNDNLLIESDYVYLRQVTT